MNKYLNIAIVAVLTGWLHGCTWVKPTPAGESVRVASADAVRNCQRKSEVTVSLKDRVAGVERNSEKVANELATLARNEGGRLGFDTVVAESTVSEGSQVFGIYACRQEFADPGEGLWMASNVVLALVLYVVLDFDRPKRGMILIDQMPMIELQASLEHTKTD